jgi:two-component system, chemotaxis family, sensor kinase CheA
VNPEFADLVPLFTEEARDRLERLAAAVPRLEVDARALAEARRELHTLKGAGRMLQIGVLAELCHAAEEVLATPRPGIARLITRVVDRLSALVDTVAAGGEPEPDAALLALLAGSPAQAPEPEPAPPRAAPAAAPVPAVSPVPERPAPFAGPAVGSAVGSAVGPAAGSPPIAAPADLRIDAVALDAIAERATQMRILALAGNQAVDRVYELARLAEEGLHEPQPKQVLAVLASSLRRAAVEMESGQRRLVHSSEEQLDKLLALQLLPLRGPLQSLGRYARDLARSLGREVEVEVEGEETRLDRRIARGLEEALLHLVRNAVDHGIEPPEARLAAGKPRAGRLRLAAAAEGARVRLEISDDGAGVDPARVVEQAVRAGLVEPAAAAGLGRDEALRLLFLPGLSTRASVSELSGRGVGLDAVAAAAGRVGGEVAVETAAGQGTTFRVEVPVARRGEQVLLLRLGGLRLALPAAVVRRAVRISAAQVIERDGRMFAHLHGDAERLVPFVPLARIYGQPTAERLLLLEGLASGRELAVAVDEVLGEQEVLVRPVARAAASDPLLEGVALLASGEPVGVLSPAALSRRGLLRGAALPGERPAVRRLRVLLVDDSLVTREMERRLLEDAGFEVRAVGDAGEALSRLAEESFGCVVTDIEMPGMDGFELTAQLRGMAGFAQLPVVVVSTRDRPEDRLRGLKAGADAYLTKQSLDAGELVDLVRRLGGAA